MYGRDKQRAIGRRVCQQFAFCGARLYEPQRARLPRRRRLIRIRSCWRSCCGSQTRAPDKMGIAARLLMAIEFIALFS